MAPQGGFYIFAHYTPGQGFKEFGLQIIVNYKDNIIHRMCLCESKHNGIDSIRGSVAVQLKYKDTVQFHYLTKNYNSFSESNLLMHVQGFLYRPISGRLVIWSVVSKDNEYKGKLDKLNYKYVIANTEQVWNSNTNQVIIPYDGTYVIDLNSYMCGRAWHGNGKLEIHAVLNGNPVIVLKIASNIDDCASRSRSAIHILRKVISYG